MERDLNGDGTAGNPWRFPAGDYPVHALRSPYVNDYDTDNDGLIEVRTPAHLSWLIMARNSARSRSGSATSARSCMVTTTDSTMPAPQWSVLWYTTLYPPIVYQVIRMLAQKLLRKSNRKIHHRT